MEPGQWLSLLGVCLLGAMSPGPSLAVVLRAAVAGGSAAGYAAALAHGAGVGLYGLLTVTGLALLIARTQGLFLALQIAGALYLVYLGIKSLRGGGGVRLEPGEASARNRPAAEGFLVAFLNPKLAVFMLALFSQFLRPHFGPGEKAIMALTVGLADAGWYALVVTLVASPAFLPRLRGSAALIDRAFGAVLILLALSVLTRALFLQGAGS